MQTVQIPKPLEDAKEKPAKMVYSSTMVIVRSRKTCPKCGQDGHYSAVRGFENCENGARFFCPHCGHTILDGGF